MSTNLTVRRLLITFVCRTGTFVDIFPGIRSVTPRTLDNHSGGRAIVAIFTSLVSDAASRYKKIRDFVRARKPSLEEISVNSTLKEAIGLVFVVARHAGIAVEFQTAADTVFNVNRSLIVLDMTSLLRRSVLALTALHIDERKIQVIIWQIFESQFQILIEHNGQLLTSDESNLPVAFLDVPASYLACSIWRTIIDRNGGDLTVASSRNQPSVC